VDGKTYDRKVLKEGADVSVGEIIGFVGKGGGSIVGKEGVIQYHIHWSVSPEDRTDQERIPTPGSPATQLDPTPLLTPNGNLNANGEKPWITDELSWWCNNGVYGKSR